VRVSHHPLCARLARQITAFPQLRARFGLPFPVCDLGNAGTVIALMAFARHKGVNLSVLGIGVDFLQVRRAPTPGSPPWAVRSCRMHWDGSFACSQDAVGPLDAAHVLRERGPPSALFCPSPLPHPPMQVVSVFSSFGFQWPVQLNKLFAASSMSTFNEQLMAPECSIGSWSFELKCVRVRTGAPPCKDLVWLWMATSSVPLLLPRVRGWRCTDGT
jgi:hypothetical protein